MIVKHRYAFLLALIVPALALGGYLWFRVAMRVPELPGPAPNSGARLRPRPQGGSSTYGSRCFDPDSRKEVPCASSEMLVDAAEAGDAEGANRLLARRTDTKTLNDALFAAARSAPGCPKDPCPKPDEAHGFHYARIATLLLEKGADIEARDRNGDTPLIAAAGHGEDDVVRLLLDRGAHIEATDNPGLTALIAAACNCAMVDMPDTYDSVGVLLERGANVEARDKRGRTALMAAAEWDRPRQVTLLLDRGAKVDAGDKRGNTALHIAALSARSTNAVEILLKRGADIEARNEGGDTPLILAASAGDVKVVQLLLDRRADPQARNKQGNTALELARKNGRTQTAAILGASVAKPR